MHIFTFLVRFSATQSPPCPSHTHLSCIIWTKGLRNQSLHSIQELWIGKIGVIMSFGNVSLFFFLWMSKKFFSGYWWYCTGFILWYSKLIWMRQLSEFFLRGVTKCQWHKHIWACYWLWWGWLWFAVNCMRFVVFWKKMFYLELRRAPFLS